MPKQTGVTVAVLGAALPGPLPVPGQLPAGATARRRGALEGRGGRDRDVQDRGRPRSRRRGDTGRVVVVPAGAMTAALPEALARSLVGLAGATVAGWALNRPAVSGLTRRERLAWALASACCCRRSRFWLCSRSGPGRAARSCCSSRRSPPGSRFAYRFVPQAAPAPAAGSPRRLLPSRVVALWRGRSGLADLPGRVARRRDVGDGLPGVLGLQGQDRLSDLEGGLPRRLFQDPALYFAHPRVSAARLAVARVALPAFVGRWNDAGARAATLRFAQLATLLAISGFLERRVSRTAGAAAAALAALCAFL